MRLPDRVVLILAVLVALGSGLWWLLGRGPAQVPPSDASTAQVPEKIVEDASVATADHANQAARASAAARRLPGTWVDVGDQFAGEGRPLMIGLHGRGDTAAHFAGIAARMGPGANWRFLEGPARFRDGAAWFSRKEGAGAATEMERAVELIRSHAADARGRPLALVGFSQGCMTALQVVLAHPRLIDAVVCIGGRVMREPRMAAAPRRTRLLFVHGAADSVVPIADARRAIQIMENRGFMTEIIEHAGGHEIPTAEMDRIARWLAERLAASPSAKSGAAAPPSSPRPTGSESGAASQGRLRPVMPGRATTPPPDGPRPAARAPAAARP